VPPIEYAAKLMALQLNLAGKTPETEAVEVPKDIVELRWNYGDMVKSLLEGEEDIA